MHSRTGMSGWLLQFCGGGDPSFTRIVHSRVTQSLCAVSPAALKTALLSQWALLGHLGVAKSFLPALQSRQERLEASQMTRDLTALS